MDFAPLRVKNTFQNLIKKVRYNEFDEHNVHFQTIMPFDS